MTDYLAYWKNYKDDADSPADVSRNWRTKLKWFYTCVETNDHLWVVISGGHDDPSEWQLLQQICVKTREIEKSRYGKYHIIGDKKRSQVFDPKVQPDFALVLKKLDFASGKKIALEGKRIGQAIQTIRRLSDSDCVLLDDYSKTLNLFEMNG
ncbi:hypothetical protein BAC2_00847 [uncultured bacterium]|nr:hypothetical protein BAC2_00847 [uncultured bacterium]